MTNPTGSPSPYQPTSRPRKPPTRDPTIPRSAVMKKPPGSRPGIRNLATIPTARPKSIHPMMYIALSPSKGQFVLDRTDPGHVAGQLGSAGAGPDAGRDAGEHDHAVIRTDGDLGQLIGLREAAFDQASDLLV